MSTYILRHVKATLTLVLCILFAGCGDLEITINVSGGSGSGGGGGSGGTGGTGGGCVAHFDPQTGAEDDACTIVEEPLCEKGQCGDDGMCFKTPFPAGAPCGSGKTCDGAGHCIDAPTCDPAACDDGNECTGDFCVPEGGCLNGPHPRSHLCGNRASLGHCDPDTVTCCVGVFVQDAAIDSGLPQYHCAAACPPGQTPDPQTAVCM